MATVAFLLGVLLCGGVVVLRAGRVAFHAGPKDGKSDARTLGKDKNTQLPDLGGAVNHPTELKALTSGFEKQKAYVNLPIL